MAAVIELPYSLPRVSQLSAPSKKVALSAPVNRPIGLASPVRKEYEQLASGEIGFKELDELIASRTPVHEENVEADDDLGTKPESKQLLSLDPNDWKNHDIYDVLGLADYRFNATEEQIKKANHKKVLRHHPDKKAGKTGHVNDDSFFKCIQKAYETLMNPEKRRQFDSIDPVANEEDEDLVPEDKVKPEEFFNAWGPLFEREARFSKIQPVPKLGTIDSTKAEVEAFYDFWFKFDSWRTFEWLDKETPEGSESRDEKRYAEKKNKSERARRKNEDNQRLHDLVDRSLAQDPRIKLFKQREKEERERKRQAKLGANPAAQAQAAALKKKQEEEEAKKAEEEKKAAQPQLSKKEKEAQRKREQKARKLAAQAAAANGN